MTEITPIIIDLEKAKNEKLDESFLATLGWGVKGILKAIFGDLAIPVELKGNPSDVRSFLKPLSAEKGYIENFKKFGLDNPRTYRSKGALASSILKFERNTGIKWPLK